MKYLANDGKIFDIEEECRRYENLMNIKRIRKRKFDMIYGSHWCGNECFIEFFDVANRTELFIVRNYCKEKVESLYGFDEEEIKDVETVNKYPFTAVVLRNGDEWAELLIQDKTEFIKRFENFTAKLDEV